MDQITSQAQLDKDIQEHKSFIVIFSAVWSAISEATRKNYERLGANHSGLYLAWISTDDNPGLAEQNNVTAIPTMYGYKDGTRVARFVGPQLRDNEVEGFIQKVL